MSKREADGYCAWHPHHGKQLFFANEFRNIEQMKLQSAECGWTPLHDLWLSTEPPDEWVSVKERLPEVGKLVECSFCGIVSYGKFNGRVWVVNDEPEESLVKTDIISFVSHWRPLPLPPKSEGEKDAK